VQRLKQALEAEKETAKTILEQKQLFEQESKHLHFKVRDWEKEFDRQGKVAGLPFLHHSLMEEKDATKLEIMKESETVGTQTEVPFYLAAVELLNKQKGTNSGRRFNNTDSESVEDVGTQTHLTDDFFLNPEGKEWSETGSQTVVPFPKSMM